MSGPQLGWAGGAGVFCRALMGPEPGGFRRRWSSATRKALSSSKAQGSEASWHLHCEGSCVHVSVCLSERPCV